MTEDPDLTRRGGRIVYTEDKQGNRTLVHQEPEHAAPDPTGPEPVAETAAAPALSAPDPAEAHVLTTDAALTGDAEQKGKRK
jgi:hypothetical protein